MNTRSDGAALYLAQDSYGTNGKTVWQHFSVQFAPGFRATDGVWNWFAEWHNNHGFEQFIGPKMQWEFPNLCWTVRLTRGVPRIAMRIIGGASISPRTKWVNGPRLHTAHWYDFRVRSTWSPDPRTGRVDWWLDGKHVFGGRAATLYTRPDGSLSAVYFVLDNYRLHASWSSTIMFDGVRLGPTRASVKY